MNVYVAPFASSDWMRPSRYMLADRYTPTHCRPTTRVIRMILNMGVA